MPDVSFEKSPLRRSATAKGGLQLELAYLGKSATNQSYGSHRRSPFGLIPREANLASLSATPPTLAISEDDLKKWGYIWRVGTKVRTKKKAGEDEDAPEEDSMNEGDVLAADTGDEAEFVSADGAVQVELEDVDSLQSSELDEASATVTTLTAEAAGVPPEVLSTFKPDKKYASAFSKKQGMDFGLVFDMAVGEALATMLGDIEVIVYKGSKKAEALTPRKPNCVEVGPARIIGGIRPQNFDVAYRPDGVRIAYDSKTLNDVSSIRKNWQNMINDLGTEATTVHTRFPYAIVAFLVAVPKPALKTTQQADLIRTLERLATRNTVINQNHLAEAISFVVWNPVTGKLDTEIPAPESPLRIEKLMPTVHARYVERYKGLPPHDK